MVQITLSGEFEARYHAMTPKMRKVFDAKIESIIAKTLVPKRKLHRREWKIWPSQNRVTDGLRLVDELRNPKYVRRGGKDDEKILTADLVAHVSPLPRNQVDRLMGLVAQSIVDEAARLEPAVRVHSRKEYLEGDRHSRGHGPCYAAPDRQKWLAALDQVEAKLRARTQQEGQMFSASSPSSSDPPSSPLLE
jgi:hypothetical protein